jgi:hypothetical protein
LKRDAICSLSHLTATSLSCPRGKTEAITASLILLS